MTTNQKGTIAELAITLAAVELGVDVYRPSPRAAATISSSISVDGCVEFNASGRRSKTTS
jgi:hypothetical protein